MHVRGSSHSFSGCSTFFIMEEDGFLRRNVNKNLLVGAAVVATALTVLNVVAEEEEEDKLYISTPKFLTEQDGIVGNIIALGGNP